MLDRGITVALATDGPGSNNRQDMFETCKAAVLLQKVDRLDPKVLQPEEILTMACRNGSRLVGGDENLGSLELGNKADLVVVDLNSPFVAPVHRVASALVYCSTPRDVVHVMVDGHLLLKDRELTTVDETHALVEATKAAQAVFTRARITTRLA
jgi:5-methylthioadenosine/S-adenosylhomocysteine deaminase